MKKLTIVFLVSICFIFCFSMMAGCEFLNLGEPVHRHLYDEWMITKNRTCTEDGERERYCSCGDRQVSIMAALGHKYVEYEGGQATCTEEGWEAYKICVNCGEGIEKSVIPALGHNFESHEAKAAACTERGWAAYESCTRCGCGTYTEIPALGHNYGDWEETEKATCLSEGEEKRVCSRDGHTETRSTDKLFHNFVEKIIIQPSCEEDGLKCKECSVCKTRIENEVIPAAGHSYGEWIEETAPTCLKEGTQKRVCANDNTHTETRTAEKLSHILSEWITKVEPTCETDGLKFRECLLCHSRIDTETLSATGHNLCGWIIGTEPSCEEDGYKYKECSVCLKQVETQTLPAYGHVSGEWIVDKAASCISDGCRHIECTVCEKVLSTESIEAFGHSYGDNVCTRCETDFGGTKGLRWELSADGAGYSLTGIGDSVADKIIIPETYNGKSVTEIGFRAFSGCEFLTEITIPESVTVIGRYAFKDCKLTSVVFAVTEGWAFYGSEGNKKFDFSEISDPRTAAVLLTNEY